MTKPSLLIKIQDHIDHILSIGIEKPFAVFDADETLWKGDIEFTLMAHMEEAGLLDAKKLETKFPEFDSQKSSFSTFIAAKMTQGESDSYGWLRWVLDGFSYKTVKNSIEDLFRRTENICIKSEKTLDITPPKILSKQRDLIHYLIERGVEIFVVTASVEETVRLALTSDLNGYSLKEQNIIGLETEFKNTRTGETFNPRRFFSQPQEQSRPESLDSELWIYTDEAKGIETWHGGKLNAIETYITNQYQPILVAGDSPSDIPMQLSAHPRGVKIYVHHSDSNNAHRKKVIAGTKKAIPSAPHNWYEVEQQSLL